MEEEEKGEKKRIKKRFVSFMSSLFFQKNWNKDHAFHFSCEKGKENGKYCNFLFLLFRNKERLTKKEEKNKIRMAPSN
jgi:hypothetical protein